VARYLVTGVAGFIGSKVTEFLLADGHSVVGVDNLNDAYDVRLKLWRLDQIKDHPNFYFHKLDIRDREGLHELFNSLLATRDSSLAAVVNLAARAGVRQSVENPWIYFNTNVTGTLNLLELCREFNVKKFVLASSSSVYGKDNPMPYREDTNTDHPLSPYAASKKAAEALCYTYHYLYGIDVTVLRYFTVYGPAGRPGMSLFRFVQWISEGRPVIVYGDGEQSRDFTYVDDIAQGTIAALKPLRFGPSTELRTGPSTGLRAAQAQQSGCWPFDPSTRSGQAPSTRSGQAPSAGQAQERGGGRKRGSKKACGRR